MSNPSKGVESEPIDGRGIWPTVRTYGRMIRFSHTVFGLPFAMASTALAHRYAVEHGLPGLTWGRLLLIVVAFTGARSAAMGFNRIVDRKIDALNPRTAARELPAGVISVRTAWLLTALASSVFIASAWALGPLPGLLSPLCLLVIGGYSFFKRFSWSSHIVLGMALALAPGGAWIAVTGTFDGWPTPLLLMVAVATWVAGFDILYSLSDVDFDRRQGLHSVPARFGVVGALWLSGALHVGTVMALTAVHLGVGLPWPHAAGVTLVGAILIYEHWIVRPADLSRLGKAFFDLNGYVSIAYLFAVLASL